MQAQDRGHRPLSTGHGVYACHEGMYDMVVAMYHDQGLPVLKYQALAVA